MTSRYRSRKFILALLALVSAYITGNVSQKWVEKKAEATQ